ncbi:MAG: NADH-quinone oxidoreductase subunit L, partial [Dehalococcoidales bacterium]|nr:NADH-quinone oxidoreductase subunit L [Dehalococcoidales bacterium]
MLPVFSFIIISFFVRPFVKAESRITGYILITALFTVLALSIWTLLSVMAAPHHEIPVPDINWVVIEGGVTIHLGLIADSLTAVMLIVVTLVSLMVQIYSQGYMHGDPGYHRYFAWMSLFTASMLGLVLADNLLFLFVFWELVGLCSYLLIG